MGATSIWHWIILLLIVVLLFGRGKISEIMSDVAKGIKSFKKGMAEDETAAKSEADRKVLEQNAAKPAEPAATENSKAT
jgi:sec-independent protein translocase protein TatA